MPATIFSGPTFAFGNMMALTAAQVGSAVPEYNLDAGPAVSFMGDSIPDIRVFFQKDRVQGNAGEVPAFLNLSYLQSVDQIPAAFSASNIAAAQSVTNGTAMTLASANVTGVTTNIPIIPFSFELNGNPVVTAPLVLDFGFAFGNVTSGSTTVVVADSTQFVPGMPLVIAAVGNAAGTAALLTNVQSITDATHIVVANTPLASANPTPIGAGNLWGVREGLGYPTPTAHLPFIAAGPGLFLDSRQAIARAVSIAGASGGTGGAFKVSGWDTYWQPMTQTITVGAGAVTGWGTKAFKAISSVVPQFTDATHNYTVGTSDVFGFHFRSTAWEFANEFWAGSFATSNAGWTAADTTSPATSATNDVRGTLQTATANGGGTGLGTTATNGTVVSLAMSGRRLAIFQSIRLFDLLNAFPANSISMFGVTQA